MGAPIIENTERLQSILEQVYNLPNQSATSEDCLVKDDIASDNDVLEFVIGMNYINPVSSEDNVVYTDNNGNVYVL